MNIQKINNSTSFNAKLIMNAKTNQPERFKNIADIFEKNTKDDKNTVMTYFIDNSDYFTEEGVKINDYILIFNNKLSNMLATLSDYEIANKFKKALLCLKREDKWHNTKQKIASDKVDAASWVQSCMDKANYLKKDGYNIFANVYNMLVANKRNKLKAIENEKQQNFNKFLEDIKTIVDGDKDFTSYIEASSCMY